MMRRKSLLEAFGLCATALFAAAGIWAQDRYDHSPIPGAFPLSFEVQQYYMIFRGLEPRGVVYHLECLWDLNNQRPIPIPNTYIMSQLDYPNSHLLFVTHNVNDEMNVTSKDILRPGYIADRETLFIDQAGDANISTQHCAKSGEAETCKNVSAFKDGLAAAKMDFAYRDACVRLFSDKHIQSAFSQRMAVPPSMEPLKPRLN
jgi:hypothetical protein